MKKWLPFKSLQGQYELLNKMMNDKDKIVCPELSIDEIDDLNRALVTLKRGDKTSVTYFQDGQIFKKSMTFIRCDGCSKTVFFKGMSLPFSSLLKMEI